MKRQHAALCALPLALSACSSPEVLPEFQSAQERECFLEARAAISDPNTSLRRSSDGFVLTTLDQGFLVSTERSPIFDECMSAGTGPENVLSDQGTLTFTASEQLIWDSLSDAQKADAFDAIRNGSTLTDWAASSS